MGSDARDLAGTVVVVTGAGSGIGAAIARDLTERGARVVLVDLRPEAVRGIAAGLGPDCTEIVVGDAGDPEVAQRAIRAGADRWGRVDSVVANAGVGRFGGLLDHTDDEIAAMSDTNFLGTVWLARAAVAHFRSREGGGDVVVMSSAAGLGHGGGSEAVYAATKAAQRQFALSLDREVRAEGIRVSTIAPAAVNTGFAASTGRFGGLPPEEGPYLRPEDVAFAVVTVLGQPRRLRTTVWSLWSAAEPM
ncbi:SDR family NAD(P)-dependent oxidoreductase [Leucobacter sp. CSA1]|uniref:SDR family NAD(P)-dependent oxidoreductase n=1 Tax=Leucobacter chromiisoli TaxID=2796471 RepID=A0A934Q6X0_9MICO|nr:SDR family NAD(P)-dependent oxidoreductase [Leucobacter chromiisoli]MBK0418841.1 SDR family NAD(P)-dependent oxidoreductase [Leucobacter chromiisoli]